MKKNLLTLMMALVVPFLGTAQDLDIYGSVLGNNGPIANTEVSVYNSQTGNTLGDVLSTTTTDATGAFAFYLNSQEATDIIGIATAACPNNPSFLFNNPTGTVDTLYVVLSCATGTGGGTGEEALYIGGSPVNASSTEWFFTSSAIGEVASYSWSIEDETYTTAEVTHTFSDFGEYEVSLTAQMASGNELTASTYIWAIDTNYCDASFFPFLDSLASSGVVFINGSYGDGIEFFWDFGDGSTSTEPYPTYVFADSLEYEVCLTVSSESCESTFCMTLSQDIINGWAGTGTGGRPGEEGLNSSEARSSGFEFKVVPMNTGTLSANAEALNVNLSVFPNPSSGNFSLSLDTENPETGLIRIFDMNGRTVYQQIAALSQGSNVFNLSLNELPGGVYLLSFNGAMNVGTRKLVIRR